MMRKIIFITTMTLLLQMGVAKAGATGSEDLKDSGKNTADECFEGFSRSMFKLNNGLDKAIFKPVAKGYRALPSPIRKGTGNVVGENIEHPNGNVFDQVLMTGESIKLIGVNNNAKNIILA